MRPLYSFAAMAVAAAVLSIATPAESQAQYRRGSSFHIDIGNFGFHYSDRNHGGHGHHHHHYQQYRYPVYQEYRYPVYQEYRYPTYSNYRRYDDDCDHHRSHSHYNYGRYNVYDRYHSPQHYYRR